VAEDGLAPSVEPGLEVGEARQVGEVGGVVLEAHDPAGAEKLILGAGDRIQVVQGDGTVVADGVADETAGVGLGYAEQVAGQPVDGLPVGPERALDLAMLPTLGLLPDQGQDPVAVRQTQIEAGAQVA
jgi:hypothetical protein